MLKSKVVLEKKVKFSDSMLWRLQREFFESQGINAWVNQVPFYITSNPFIPNVYANVAIRYIQDHVQQKNYEPSEPFYIMELGTGSGKFSYYVMKRIFELQKALRLEDVKIQYVMTDFTNSNLDFWEAHELLIPYRDEGKLDFAIYDLERTKEIELIHSNKILKQGNVANPIIAFGNYIFDTVNHDAFHVEDGKLSEALVRTSTTSSNLKKKQPVDMEKLEVDFEYRNISADNYYMDEHLNTVLKEYPPMLKKASFLVPVGGIECIKTLKSLSNDKLLVISTDKGYTDDFEMEGATDPQVVFHGSFSMMVNFHAMGRYFKASGGDYFFQTSRRGIKTCVFISGEQFENLPETSIAIDAYVQRFGPADFFNFHDHMKASKDDGGLRILASHMQLCHWDPHVFKIYAPHIKDEIASADPDLRDAFVKGMPKIEENFYFIPNRQDPFFDMAMLYHSAHCYQEAMESYEKSIQYFGVSFSTAYNVGLCYYLADQFDKALAAFEKAVELDPSSEEAVDWVKRIKEESMI